MVEAEAAASEVAAMPAGTHVMLDQVRQAVEQRANVLIAQLQELEREPLVEAVHEVQNISGVSHDLASPP